MESEIKLVHRPLATAHLVTPDVDVILLCYYSAIIDYNGDPYYVCKPRHIKQTTKRKKILWLNNKLVFVLDILLDGILT